MTIKEKKEYLKRYRKIDREVNQLLMEKDEIFSLGTKITPTYSDMPKGTGESNKIQSTIEKLEEQENKINQKIVLTIWGEREHRESTLYCRRWYFKSAFTLSVYQWFNLGKNRSEYALYISMGL